MRRFHPAPGGARRLVCLPHAGGSASFYFPVSRALSPAVEVLSIQYPGRQDRRHEKCIGDIHDLAREVFTVLRPWRDEPLAIFGHSMGGQPRLRTRPAHRAGRRQRRAPVRLRARAPSKSRHETVHLLDDEGCWPTSGS
ncbi:alpha/beta fold hydrolase [Micromonospora sp. BRA006-A]|nr:alpha/beta fold hydrolase [Micromonospora sp. BRA006-A]